MENTAWYQRAGWRKDFESYTRETSRYGADPNWKEWLEKRKYVLNWIASDLNITQWERDNIQALPHWPIPNQMVKDNRPEQLGFVKNDIEFLTALLTLEYNELSSHVHVDWLGMMAAEFAVKPEWHEWPGKLSSDAAYKAILPVLMVLSEVVVAFKSEAKNQLIGIWQILTTHMLGAQEFYQLRYQVFEK